MLRLLPQELRVGDVLAFYGEVVRLYRCDNAEGTRAVEFDTGDTAYLRLDKRYMVRT